MKNGQNLLNIATNLADYITTYNCAVIIITNRSIIIDNDRIYTISPCQLLHNQIFEKFCSKLTKNLQDKEHHTRIKVKFKNIDISTYNIKSMYDLFDYMSEFEFFNAGLNYHSINLLANYLKSDSSKVTTIHLEGNILSPQALDLLSQSFIKNQRLTKVYLNGTHDFSRYNYYYSYKNLSQAINHSKIEILSLEQTQNGNFTPIEYLNLFTKTLAHNTTLHTLIFGNLHAKNDCQYLLNSFANAVAQNGNIHTISRKTKGARIFLSGYKHKNFNLDLQNLYGAADINLAKINSFFYEIHQGNIQNICNNLNNGKFNVEMIDPRTGYNAYHHAINAKSNAIKIIHVLHKYNCTKLMTRCHSKFDSENVVHKCIKDGYKPNVLQALLANSSLKQRKNMIFMKTGTLNCIDLAKQYDPKYIDVIKQLISPNLKIANNHSAFFNQKKSNIDSKIQAEAHKTLAIELS